MKGKMGNIVLLKRIGIASAVLVPVAMIIRIVFAEMTIETRTGWGGVDTAAIARLDAIALQSIIIALVCIVAGIIMIIVARNLKKDIEK